MAENELQVKITSDVASLKAGLTEASSMFDWVTKSIEEQSDRIALETSKAFSSIPEKIQKPLKDSKEQMISFGDQFGEIFHKINSVAAMFGVSIASYLSVRALKGAVDAALNYRETIEQLSRAMGITSESASVLNVALKMIGVSTETYISANMKLAMHVKANESALNQLGVVTRATNGQFLTQDAIFKNAISTMSEYKAGADRNQFALYAFGRNAQAVYELMRLNNRVMTEAREVAERYGLVIDNLTSDKYERHAEKLNVMKLLFEAIKIKIGMELIPELTKMSGWFSDIGPGAINVFVIGAKALIAVVDLIGTGFKQLAILIVGAVGSIVAAVSGIVEAAIKLGSLDFSGALDSLKGGASEFAANWQVAFSDFVEAGNAAAGRINTLFGSIGGKKAEGPATPAPGAGGRAFVAPEAPSDLLSKWKDELNQRMMAENAFFGWSAEREKAFWDEKLATIKGSGKEEIKLRQDVRTEIFAIEKKGANDALQTTIGNLKLEQESAKLTGKERVSIQDQILAAIEAAGARETSIYRNAQLERERLVQREAVFEIEQQQKILEANLEASKTIIESKINEVNTQYELGNISSERQLVQLKTLLNQKYKLELDNFHRIAALWDQYPEKYQESQNKIRLAAAKHSKEIGAVENKASLQAASEWKKGFDSIAQSMNINWIGVLKGTQTLQDQMIGIGENIANQMINAFWRMAVEQIAAETFAAITSKSVTGQTAMSKIYSHAASAAVGAYDAFSSIPYVGPIIGAIAAAAVFAACIAYGAYVGSAAGGWDVDKDSLAYVHKNEMVLPAGIAEGFRDIIAGRGTPNAGPSQQTIKVNYNVQTLDTTGMRRALIRHTPTIAKVLRNQGRPYGIR